MNYEYLIQSQKNFLNEKKISKIEINKIMKTRIDKEFILVESQKKYADIIINNLNFNSL